MNRKAIAEAMEEFNKYRSPEGNAKLLSASEESFEIEFTGSFCKTCGFHDYFEDFRLILEEKGLRTKTGEIKEIDQGARVEFKNMK